MGQPAEIQDQADMVSYYYLVPTEKKFQKVSD